MPRRRAQVFGPAYLDRVLVVDRPLRGPDQGDPLDQSVDGTLEFGLGLRFEDNQGSTLDVTLPADWPGPTGLIRVTGRLGVGRLSAVGVSWHDDLGGMGAGFASTLRGELVSALGPADDPFSRVISGLLEAEGVAHHPIRVDRPADWTLLLTSGPHGDKLPVGFRGCHSAVAGLDGLDPGPCDLRVVASLPNRLAEQALRLPGAAVSVFAPAMRNMADRSPPISAFAEPIDVLCCNRSEWERLDDREQVAWQVSILSVTDGPRGSEVRFTQPDGEAGRVVIPVFPRVHPPADTNRAGEAYAATLVTALLDLGWAGGPCERSLVELAARRASAAAALVLDRVRFGFPTAGEIDEAIRHGVVDGDPSA